MTDRKYLVDDDADEDRNFNLGEIVSLADLSGDECRAAIDDWLKEATYFNFIVRDETGELHLFDLACNFKIVDAKGKI